MSDLYFGLDTNARLVGADPKKDQMVGKDELGRTIYEMRGSKKRYYVGDVEAPASLPETAKSLYEAIPPVEDWRLPSGEEFWGGIKGAAQAIGEGVWDAVSAPTNPEASLGNAMDAASMGFTGAFTRVGQALDPSVLSAGGAAPRYLKKPSTIPDEMSPRIPNREVGNRTLRRYETGEYVDDDLVDLEFTPAEVDENGFEALNVDPEAFDPIYYGRDITLHDIAEIDLGRTTPEELANYYGMDATPELLDYIQNVGNTIRQTPEYQNYLDSYRQMNEPWHPMDGHESEHLPQVPQQTDFRSPLREVLDGWEFPKNGITGAQFLKGLQDNPTIRNSEIKSWGLQLDPQARYTKEELTNLIEPRQYSTFVENRDVFRDYQRQADLADPEVDYTELVIRGSREDNPFQANSQHFSNDTLAHTRVSERKGPEGNYLLIEEIQSDLLQKGYAKPKEPLSAEYFNRDITPRIREMMQTSEVGQDNLLNLSENLRNIVAPVLDKPSLTVEEARDLYKKFITNSYVEGTGEARYSLDNLLEFADDFSDDEFRISVKEQFLDRVNNSLTSLYPENSGDLWDFRLYLGDLFARMGGTGVGLPPVAKTEETVRLSIEAAIAEADKRGLTQVVIPPFEKILEKRFWDIDQLEKARDPKSGFYATYIKSVGKVLDGLKTEFGDSVTISQRPLNYRGGGVSATDWSSWLNNFGDVLENRAGQYLPPRTALRRAGIELEAWVESTIKGGNRPPSREVLHVINTLQEDLGVDISPWMTSVQNHLNGLEGDPGRLYEFIKKSLAEKDGKTLEGTVIDFSGLAQEGYDLQTPKFAEGGMVEEGLGQNPIWQHHMNNVNNKTYVVNPDKSVSTVLTTIMGDGEYEYLIPRVWDGQILSEDDAWNRAMESGIHWPSAPAGEEGVKALEELDKRLHKDMQPPSNFATGGSVENPNIDPVSGNSVPPGATPKEVRDDVQINASEGEYVIPANVVRFLGLDRIERMVENAKKKLMEMEQNGRIGGQKEDDLPFSPEELVASEEPEVRTAPQAPRMAAQNMAEGGVVTGGYQLPTVPEGINPLTGLPYWMEEQAAATNTENTVTGTDAGTADADSKDGRRNDKSSDEPVTGIAGSVKTWTPEDFVKYGTMRTSPDSRFAKGLVSAIIPMGGAMVGMRQRYLEKTVPEKIEEMLSTGFDLQGNALTEDQIVQLRDTAATINSTPLKGGLRGIFDKKAPPSQTLSSAPVTPTPVGGGGVAGGGYGGSKPSTSPSYSPPERRGNDRDDRASPGARGVGQETASGGRQVTDMRGGDYTTSGKQMSNPGGFDRDKGKWGSGPMAKGGLIVRRKK